MWRVAEADRHAIGGIHQTDRDREVDQLLLTENRACCLVCFVRHTRLGHTRHRLGPGQGGALCLGEEVAAFLPGLNQGEFLDRRSEEHTSELQSLMRISYA